MEEEECEDRGFSSICLFIIVFVEVCGAMALTLLAYDIAPMKQYIGVDKGNALSSVFMFCAVSFAMSFSNCLDEGKLPYSVWDILWVEDGFETTA